MNRIFFQITIKFRDGSAQLKCVSEKKNAESICTKHKALPNVTSATFKQVERDPNV